MAVNRSQFQLSVLGKLTLMGKRQFSHGSLIQINSPDSISADTPNTF